MLNPVHGARIDPKRQHPVLDIRHWEAEFPIGDWRKCDYSVATPEELARAEQARRLASVKGPLGPSVPADVFVWSDSPDHERPWLTRIGGIPWREKGKPWPKGPDGVPLCFLAQICFVDSKDILAHELPGDVALIFGQWSKGWATIFECGVLEWSNLKLKEPQDLFDLTWTTELPFKYGGVIHRTVQYTDWRTSDPAFEAAGFKDGGFFKAAMQATSIGSYSGLPQGWPFEAGDGCSLVAVLSSFSMNGRWPLVDVPNSLVSVDSDGVESQFSFHRANDLNVHGVGCAYIYRDGKGEFKMQTSTS